MKLTINNKECDLYFGLNFIRELDKLYTVDFNGASFGAGLQSVMYYIEMRNPVVLLNLILCASKTSKVRPTHKEIESWLEEQDLELLFNDFLLSLETSPMTRPTILKMKNQTN
ncbi:tail assembly chaperone [Gemella sp. GH3]|uniref:tail assembly chaperone n=1 Tax=unclassified Gemella TaxID=2624949 RepID=UPI0015CF9895|nr:MULTISPECIES: tail assembly chaperone [unclassified Gemella]MBF0714492.1 tail assembly chaperone [Gemella sp. GH3.1]NYS51444.1 tail assembly chaperone [Gemella sp. GH3]